jgi:hypothetical protein
MYYSHEAGESAIKDIRSIIKTLGEVKSGELDYLTYRGTIKYLNDLIEQIEKEDKSLSMKFNGIPTLTDEFGNRYALMNVFNSYTQDLSDAIEDSHSIDTLVKNIRKIESYVEFFLDRETPTYVRLKGRGRYYTYYLTIRKIEG